MTGEIEFVCSWLFVHLFSCVVRACLGDALLPLQHRDGASGLGQVQRAPQTHDAAAHNDDGRRGSPPHHLLLLWRRRRTKVWLENTQRMRVNGRGDWMSLVFMEVKVSLLGSAAAGTKEFLW